MIKAVELQGETNTFTLNVVYDKEPVMAIVDGYDFPVYEEVGMDISICKIIGKLPDDWDSQKDEYLKEIKEKLKS